MTDKLQCFRGELRKISCDSQTFEKYITDLEKFKIFLILLNNDGIDHISLQIPLFYLKIAKLRKQVVELGGSINKNIESHDDLQESHVEPTIEKYLMENEMNIMDRNAHLLFDLAKLRKQVVELGGKYEV